MEIQLIIISSDPSEEDVPVSRSCSDQPCSDKSNTECIDTADGYECQCMESYWPIDGEPMNGCEEAGKMFEKNQCSS